MKRKKRKQKNSTQLYKRNASYGATIEFLNTISGEFSTVALIIILPPTNIVLERYLSEKLFILINGTASKFLTFRFFFKGSMIIGRYILNKKSRKKINQLIRKQLNYSKRLTFWAKRRFSLRGYLLDLYCEEKPKHFRGVLKQDHDRFINRYSNSR